jgi:hypothetical protein
VVLLYVHSVTEGNGSSTLKNNVIVCDQITIFTLYSISYKLVTLLKETDAPAEVCDIRSLTVSLNFINFNFQMSLHFAPEMSTGFMSYIVQNIYIALVGSCTHCILACYPRSKNREHSYVLKIVN